MNRCGINIDSWEDIATGRRRWREIIGVIQFEAQRLAVRDAKGQHRKAQVVNPTHVQLRRV